MVTTSDLVVPGNIRDTSIVLVQEGMTDPENDRYRLVRRLRLPRYLGNTSMVGLSHAYVALSRTWTARPADRVAARAVGARALSVRADVADADSVRRLLRVTLAHFGRVDGLVDNTFRSMSGTAAELRATCYGVVDLTARAAAIRAIKASGRATS